MSEITENIVNKNDQIMNSQAEKEGCDHYRRKCLFIVCICVN